MLIITGTLGEETFENDIIAPKKLIEYFDLKEYINKGKGFVRFDVGGKHKKVDNSSQVFVPTELKIMASFSATYKDDSFDITYYEKRVREKNSNPVTYRYEPRKLVFYGNSVTLNVQRDLDKIVFLLLCPDNAKSLLHEEGYRVKFETYTPDKDAVSKMQAFFRESQVRAEIATENIDILRSKAMGLGVGNMKGFTDLEVRAKLVERMERKKREGKLEQFYEEFQSDESLLAGLLQECMNRSIIQRKVENGQHVFYWGPAAKELKGKVIHNVSKGVKPKESLYQYAVANYDFFVNRIQDLLAYVKENTKLAAKMKSMKEVMRANGLEEKPDPKLTPVAVKDMETIDIVGEMFAREALYFDRAKSAMFFLKSGEIDEEICEIKDKKRYIEEVTAFLDDNSEALKKAKLKLNAIRNFSKEPSGV